MTLEIRQFASSWVRLGKFVLFIALPLVAIALLLGHFLDSAIAAYFKPLFGSPVHVLAVQSTDIGKADWYFLIAGLAWIALFAGLRLRWLNERWRPERGWAFGALLSFVISGVLVQAMKHLVGRARPYADDGLSSFTFAPMTANYEFHSFPSGHSQVLFTAATVLALRFPKLTLIWYALALVFAATRVITLNHWLSDVLVGAVVGLLGTLLTVRLLARTRAAF